MAVPEPAHCSSFDSLSYTLESAHTEPPSSSPWLQNPGQEQERWVHLQRIGYTEPMTSAKCIVSFATPRLRQPSPPPPHPASELQALPKASLSFTICLSLSGDLWSGWRRYPVSQKRLAECKKGWLCGLEVTVAKGRALPGKGALWPVACTSRALQ